MAFNSAVSPCARFLLFACLAIFLFSCKIDNNDAYRISVDQENLDQLVKDGRYAEALPLEEALYEQYLITYGQSDLRTLRIRNDLGFLLQQLGRFGEAEVHYRAALDGRRAILGTDNSATIRTLNNLAGLYEDQQRIGEAETAYQEALHLSKDVLGEDHEYYRETLNDLGLLLINQGRTDEAEPFIEKAYQKTQNDERSDESDRLVQLNNLGNLYFMQDRIADATEIFETVFKERLDLHGDQHPNTIRSSNNLGSVYRIQAEYDLARPVALNAVRMASKALGASHPEAIFYSLNFCRLLIRDGDINGAIQKLRKVDTALYNWVRGELQTTVGAHVRRRLLNAQEQFQNIVFTLAADHENESTAELAADVMLRWKRIEGEEEARLAAISRRVSDPSTKQLVEKVGVLRADYARKLNVTAQREADHVLRDLEQAESELAAADLTFNGAKRAFEVSAKKLRRHLGKNEGLAQFRIYRRWISNDGRQELWRERQRSEQPFRWAATYTDANGVIVFKDLGKLDDSLEELRKLKSGSRSAGSLLYARFFKPFESYVEDGGKLFVVPDSYLSTMPIDLFQRVDGKFLVEDERLQLRIVASGRDLLLGKQVDNASNSNTAEGLLAIGGIDFGSEGASPVNDDERSTDELARAASSAPLLKNLPPFSDIPFTAEEVKEIGGHYGEHRDRAVRVLGQYSVGIPASEAMLKQLSNPPQVLHLATHGFYLPRSASLPHRPMALSGLALNGANAGRTGNLDADGEDGILYAIEASGLPLDQTELVILSACDTGKGVIDYSEGVYGLVRAFKIAGVKNVLMTLSPIPDRETKDFMVRFYENWLGQSLTNPSIAEALKQTKIDFINHDDPTLRRPSVWSPWVLVEGT